MKIITDAKMLFESTQLFLEYRDAIEEFRLFDCLESLEHLDYNGEAWEEGLSERELNNHLRVFNQMANERFNIGIEICEKSNNQLIKALDKIEQILQIKKVTSLDIKYLNNLNLNCYTADIFRHQFTPIVNNEKEISNILDSTLSETRNRANLFFYKEGTNEWNAKFNEYKTSMMKFGNNAFYLISFFEKLFSTLSELENTFIGLNMTTWEDMESNRIFDDFIFEFTRIKAESEADLIKRKQIYINAIVDCDTFRLKTEFNAIDESDEIVDCYKANCEKAIENIDLQLQLNQTIVTLPEIKIEIEKKKKPETKKQTLNDFFNDNISVETIKNIQTTFCSYKAKKMAIVIYLLQSKFNIIEILPNSTTQSRKHFVCQMKSVDNYKDMYAISKYFESGTYISKVSDKDAYYILIHKKLSEIIAKEVV